MNRGQSQYKQRGRMMRAVKRHAMQKYRAGQIGTISTSRLTTSRPAAPRSKPGSDPPAPPDQRSSSPPRSNDAFYTVAQRDSASRWMWICFWLMIGFFAFCFVGLFTVLAGRGAWPDVLKPAAWSLLFSMFVCFRWSKLSRIEAGLLRQADQRAQIMRSSADIIAQEAADMSADALQRKQEKPSLDFRLRSAEAALRCIKPESVKVPVSAARSTNPLPWKSKAQRDEEWLDQELRWRRDTRHHHPTNEEQDRQKMCELRLKEAQQRESERRQAYDASVEAFFQADETEQQIQELERRIRTGQGA